MPLSAGNAPRASGRCEDMLIDTPLGRLGCRDRRRMPSTRSLCACSVGGAVPVEDGFMNSQSKQARRLRRAEASAYLKEKYYIDRKPSTLAKLACIGGGPRFQSAGRIPL